jgi:hypothetical protein
LIFGTFLTLFLVPVMYLFVAKIKEKVFKNKPVLHTSDEPSVILN